MISIKLLLIACCCLTCCTVIATPTIPPASMVGQWPIDAMLTNTYCDFTPGCAPQPQLVHGLLRIGGDGVIMFKAPYVGDSMEQLMMDAECTNCSYCSGTTTKPRMIFFIAGMYK